MERIALPLLLVLACIGLGSSTYMAEHRTLIQYIKHLKEGDYDANTRPVRNENDSLLVNIELHLTAVQGVDDATAVMTSSGWLSMTWLDEYISWDPVDFMGLEGIHVSSDMFWTPDIYLFNDAEGNFNKMMVENRQRMYVHHDGTVHWVPLVKFRSLCDIPKLNTSQVSCPLVFGSWTYPEQQLDIQTSQVSAALTQFHGNPVWELVEAKSSRHSTVYDCCPEAFADIKYDLKLGKRQEGPAE